MSKRYHGDKDLQEIQEGWDKIDKMVAPKNPKAPTNPFEWEMIDGTTTARAMVFGGWLVLNERYAISGCSQSMVFVPDPSHEWRVT